MPQISVIIPMYRVEKYIEGCLQSVQAQTFTDFECICVDDESPDNTAVKAEEFAKTDSRFKVIRKKNGGVSTARNAGVQNSSAPYVFFMDSDDYIHPQMLEFLMETMQKTNAPIVNCMLQHVSKMYKPMNPDLKFEDFKLEMISNPLDRFCKSKQIRTGVFLRLYQRKFIEHIPFLEGVYFEDVPFSVICLNEIDTLPFLHAPLYYYYRESTSIMRSTFSTQKIDSYDSLIRHLHAYFTEKAPEKLPMIRKHVLNGRIKMMLNQCIRKQADKKMQYELFTHAQKKIKALYDEKIISFDGLKLKHKIALYILLKYKAATACTFLRHTIHAY